MAQSFIDLAKDESVRTENGARTYATTRSSVLDGFGRLGAMRQQDENRIKDLVNSAVAEDPANALRMLFHIGDIRGGQGERRVMRIAVKQLATEHSKLINPYNLIRAIEEYSRWDVALELLGTPFESALIEEVNTQLQNDIKSEFPSLLAKWLPSANSRNTNTRTKGRKIAKLLGMTEKDYRKTLSALRAKIGIVETLVTEGRFDEIDLSKVPGVALKRYMNKFNEVIPEKMSELFEEAERRLEAGEETNLKTGVLYPNEVYYDTVYGNIDSKQGQTLWDSLPDYVQEAGGVLSVVDTSGSMWGWAGTTKNTPAIIANSLALYTSQKLSGPFKNHFINFNDNAKMFEFPNTSLKDIDRYMQRVDWGGSTNIQSVFDLVLNTAVRNKLPQEALPKSLVIFSDMEFNSCGYNTNLEHAREKFAQAGYELPNLVFWNVESRNDQSPVRANDQGVVLVSGASPITLRFVLSGATKTPYDLMMDVIGTKRYDLAESVIK